MLFRSRTEPGHRYNPRRRPRRRRLLRRREDRASRLLLCCHHRDTEDPERSFSAAHRLHESKTQFLHHTGTGHEIERFARVNGRGPSVAPRRETVPPSWTAAISARDGYPRHISTQETDAQPKYSGSLPGRHLMLQPRLGCWREAAGLPARTASRAARRSAPVTGRPLFGRLSSSCPR